MCCIRLDIFDFHNDAFGRTKNGEKERMDFNVINIKPGITKTVFTVLFQLIIRPDPYYDYCFICSLFFRTYARMLERK